MHTGLEYLRQKLEGQEGSIFGMLQLLPNKALRGHHQDLVDCTCGRKNQEEGWAGRVQVRRKEEESLAELEATGVRAPRTPLKGRYCLPSWVSLPVMAMKPVSRFP